MLAVVAEASAQGLTGLRRVSLAVDLQYPIDTLSVEDLLARLEDGLRQAEPAMSVNESATDRLRLVVSVRPVSGSTLRGFWLPFSGTYGIGPVMLELERLVSLPGVPRALPGDCVAGGANRHWGVANGGSGGHAAHGRADRGVAGCAPPGPLSGEPPHAARPRDQTTNPSTGINRFATGSTPRKRLSRATAPRMA